MPSIIFILFYLLGCIPLLSIINVVNGSLHVLDRIASFGPRLPTKGYIGKLIPIETLPNWGQQEPDGCHSFSLNETLIKLGKFYQEDNLIALIKRGNCSFIEKVRYMQNSGFQGVVVGNNERSGLVTMYADGDNDDVAIPSVFITQKEYKTLHDLCVGLGPDPLLIRLEPNNFFQPLLDVIIVTILSPTVMMFFVYVMWKIRQRQLYKAQLAPPDFVKNLPTRDFFIAKRQGNEPEECAICLEDYIDEDELRILPCRHEFHIACIDPWLTTRKKFCPICKRDICPMIKPATERTRLLGDLPASPTSLTFTN
ncbi:hypothetical protein K502DRAFT_338103 [Neoconidiobolus thromboides FSU 785]|nr:hypothetical protein K502DRAFT_338103 [Neoconidiobolus thromboides FSU 785]